MQCFESVLKIKSSSSKNIKKRRLQITTCRILQLETCVKSDFVRFGFNENFFLESMSIAFKHYLVCEFCFQIEVFLVSLIRISLHLVTASELNQIFQNGPISLIFGVG